HTIQKCLHLFDVRIVDVVKSIVGDYLHAVLTRSLSDYCIGHQIVTDPATLAGNYAATMRGSLDHVEMNLTNGVARMINHHVGDHFNIDRQRFVRRQHASDFFRRAEQLHREMNFMYQRQQHAAAEILAREISVAIVLVRMPVFNPLTNLTLKHQRLPNRIVSKKLLQLLYRRMKLQIVAYKRNDAALLDL